MRDLPPFVVANRQDESRTITFIRDSSAAVNHRQRWTTATSAQNQVQIPFSVKFGRHEKSNYWSFWFCYLSYKEPIVTTIFLKADIECQSHIRCISLQQYLCCSCHIVCAELLNDSCKRRYGNWIHNQRSWQTGHLTGHLEFSRKVWRLPFFATPWDCKYQQNAKWVLSFTWTSEMLIPRVCISWSSSRICRSPYG